MTAIGQFMKKNYKVLLIVVAIAAALWSFIPKQKNSPDPVKEALLLEMLTFVIKNGHYDPANIDDSFSEQVYKRYLDYIDPNKRFFLQSDVDEFATYKLKIDDEIQMKQFNFFELTYNRLKQRNEEAKQIYKDILAQPFDFTVDEEIDTDYENLAFPNNKEELKERWRKQLKLSVLTSIDDKLSIQEENKKNASENKEEVEIKSFEELEKEARENTLKSLNDYFDVMDEVTRNEWLSMYLNAILEQFDPHTNYLAPDDKQRFDESMSGSMEGIGAQLRKKNDYVEITEIIPGGPAWKANELENGDIIIKVAQGDEEPVDIAGMRLDNVVKLIKGKKGTVVKLTVKKIDGSLKVVSTIRDKFEIAETYAKSSIIETDTGPVGMIYLPKISIDFETRDNRDAFKDVAAEIEKLKKQNIQGLIMDMRGNGGGSLSTVVDMVGLFIEEGPVVQVRKPNGKKDILSDRDPRIQWDGPLVVMINNYSASAAEIFAAAIQDYNRGVVVGSKHSFGKGTVQVMYSLNDLVRIKEEDFGAIKFTSQKFYRINGGSTQLKGVESDIMFPDRFTYVDIGEKDRENAMPWDKIEVAKFKKFTYNFAPIIEKSNARIQNNEYFQILDQSARWISERQDDNKIPLEYNKFSQRSKEFEQKTKEFNVLKDYKNNLKFLALPDEIELFANDTVLKNKRDRWHKSLASDIYMDEAVRVLEDIINLN
mgnify:FL=1